MNKTVTYVGYSSESETEKALIGNVEGAKNMLKKFNSH